MHVGDVLDHGEGSAKVNGVKVLFGPVREVGDAEEGGRHEREVNQVHEGTLDVLGKLFAPHKGHNLG